MNIGYFVADEGWSQSEIRLMDDGSHFQDVAGYLMLITTDTWYQKNKGRIRNRIIYVVDTHHGIESSPDVINISLYKAKDILKNKNDHNHCVVGEPCLIQSLVRYLDKIYLTKIYTELDADDGSRSEKYPNIDRLNGWYISECSAMKLESGIQYRFVEYKGPDRRDAKW